MKFVPEGRPELAMEQMDDGLVDKLAFAGTPEDCARRVGDYEGLVDEVIYLNVGGADAGSVLEAHRGVMAVKGASPSELAGTTSVGDQNRDGRERAPKRAVPAWYSRS